jgi:hypothetical protein
MCRRMGRWLWIMNWDANGRPWPILRYCHTLSGRTEDSAKTSTIGPRIEPGTCRVRGTIPNSSIRLLVWIDIKTYLYVSRVTHFHRLECLEQHKYLKLCLRRARQCDFIEMSDCPGDRHGGDCLTGCCGLQSRRNWLMGRNVTLSQETGNNK